MYEVCGRDLCLPEHFTCVQVSQCMATVIASKSCNFFSFGATAPQWAMASSFTRFLDHTQRPTTLGTTSLDG